MYVALNLKIKCIIISVCSEVTRDRPVARERSHQTYPLKKRIPKKNLYQMYHHLVFLLRSESAPQLQGTGAGPNKMGVTSAVSDESVAGDSGVYEPSERRYDTFLSTLVAFLFSGAAVHVKDPSTDTN